MNEPIQVPTKGSKMLASWGASVANGINSLIQMSSPGMLAREGLSGNGAQPLPVNRRERKAATVLPWTFSCAIDPDTQERTGGWTNCRMQVGLDCRWRSPDIDGAEPVHENPSDPNYILDTDTCADGNHFVEVDLTNDTAKIVVSNSHDVSGDVDPENNIVRVFIGKVEEGKLDYGPHINPVIYKYL